MTVRMRFGVVETTEDEMQMATDLQGRCGVESVPR